MEESNIQAVTIPEITIWNQEIIQVRISMSYPLRWVNSYVLPCAKGIAIIDPGPRTQGSVEEWKLVLAQLGYVLQDVKQIFVTHHHPDHYGLAGWFQSEVGCPVYMSQRAYEESLLMWGNASTINEDLIHHLTQHGLSHAWTVQMEQHLLDFLPQVSPMPEVTWVEHGSYITLGKYNWFIIESGGHAPGHLSLYNKEAGFMICGDAVLPRISPNVSLIPGSDPNPLYTFITSLEQFKNYEVGQAFPGHRHPFTYFHQRIGELLQHHEERLLRIYNELLECPQSGFSLCNILFGQDISIHQMRFAMCEVLAHTQELIRRGKIKAVDASLDGNIVFATLG
ncbi:MBL fold metallo-hydrolase [Paenibacillus sp. CMAA1364]